MRNLSSHDLISIEQEYCKRSLSGFTKRAWKHFDPQPYVHGWHMDAICDHLQACATGEIKRLLINVPPGTSKSTATNVIFPAWLWGPFGWPQAKFIGASYETGLANRDARKNRQLIESEWYQERWPIAFAKDQNEKINFENAAKGFRQACAVKSMTGKRGDFVVWDDPLSPEKAYSETERETANRVFAETLPTRLVSPEKSVIIIIMQRLHEDDVSGYILSRDLGYEHLCLPMEFEPERKCYTSIGFADPRKEDGELLFPDRFPREIIDRDKKTMGEFAVAGQFQQRPVPRSGGMFKRENFGIVQALPPDCKFVRGWDLAATASDTAAYTVGAKLGYSESTKRFYVADIVRGQYAPHDAKRIIMQTAALDGREVRGSLPQDPGQAGKAQVQDLILSLAGYPYEATPESGDKETRAMPLAAQVGISNVDLLAGSWNNAFLDEICLFPGSKYKDQVDAASRAFNVLALVPQPRLEIKRF